MLAFATSAVRDAVNSDDVLDQVRERTGVDIEVLSGEDEARLTFLAVRRWFGWSAGRLAVFDIGGGSLEIAGGADERPDVAWSLPLGAARLARNFFDHDPSDDELRQLRKQIRAEIARDAGNLLRGGAPDRAAATSKTFRSLARICGAAPSGDGRAGAADAARSTRCTEWIPKLIAMSPETLADLPGRLAEPHPPDRARRAGRRGLHGHLRPDRAGDLPVGAARGRDPRAHRPALGQRRR